MLHAYLAHRSLTLSYNTTIINLTSNQNILAVLTHFVNKLLEDLPLHTILHEVFCFKKKR